MGNWQQLLRGGGGSRAASSWEQGASSSSASSASAACKMAVRSPPSCSVPVCALLSPATSTSAPPWAAAASAVSSWLLGYRGADSEPARLIARTGGPAQSRSGVVRWRRSGCKRRLWSGCGIIAKWLIEAVGGRIGRRTPSGVRRTKDSGIGHETHLLANRTHTRGRCVHGGGP